MVDIRWKDVLGYEGLYCVSNLGAIKSRKRIIIRKNGITIKIKEKIKIADLGTTGYLRVGLHNNGKTKLKTVHRIVAESFLGNYKLEVDHINGIKTDNRLVNLQYLTKAENIRKYALSVKHKRSSKYIGVSFSKKLNKWVSSVRVGKKSYYISSFKTELEAHKAYSDVENNGLENIKKYQNKTSIFKGVSWCKSKKKWVSQARKNGKQYRIGQYDNELEAYSQYKQFKTKGKKHERSN